MRREKVSWCPYWRRGELTRVAIADTVLLANVDVGNAREEAEEGMRVDQQPDARVVPTEQMRQAVLEGRRVRGRTG